MLDNYKFKSIFNNELNQFVNYKKNLGYDYKEGLRIVKRIDKIITKLNLKRKRITKEIYNELVNANERKNTSSYACHCAVVRHFCIFLTNNCNLKNIYYDYRKINYNNNYIPVLFNDTEIDILFATADNYFKEHRKYYRSYYTYAIMIRLIYACGLRVSEAINIKISDINFKEGTIKIINSKNHVSRLIPISESMKTCLINYINKINHSQELLFVNSRFHKISKSSLEKYYKKILKKANLNCNAHIHDLRHVFANKALNQMIENGYPEYVAIVYLCKYLGHKNINETIYYLHLTDYDRNLILKYVKDLSNKLYEEVLNNE